LRLRPIPLSSLVQMLIDITARLGFRICSVSAEKRAIDIGRRHTRGWNSIRHGWQARITLTRPDEDVAFYRQ
jgi:uncharacterized membrane protein